MLSAAALDAWIEDHRDAMVKDLRELLRIPSVETEAAANAPYGEANRRALDLALGWARAEGLPTNDLEGHFGYATVGNAGPLIMAIGHLDVVPEGSGWTRPPYGAELEDGYVYARGATDDKGPTVAAWYAIRALRELAPDLGVRLRMGFGCDEESGFGCLARYVATEETPTFGIAPDSGWPCYNAEKGIANLLVRLPIPAGAVRLVRLRGGSRPNIVIDEAEATIRVVPEERARVAAVVAGWYDRNLEGSWRGDDLVVSALGKAAHGSTPFFGDSAATKIFRLLLGISPVETSEFYEDLLGTGHPGGEGLGIHGMDPVTGLLSANLGVADGDENGLRLLFNIRYNVDTDAQTLREKATAKLAAHDATVEIESDSRPLYFSADHPLVRAVVETYAEKTGETKEPGAMGGGTYARAIPNTISVGTSWPGDGAAHQPDERIAVESLVRAAKIYAAILLRLAHEATKTGASA